MDERVKTSRGFRAFLGMAALGVAALLIGLAWDARLHEADPDLAASEGVFTLGNPGHVLAALGVVLVAAGVAGAGWIVWLRHRAPLTRVTAALVLTMATLAAGAVVIAGGAEADHAAAGDGRDHGGRNRDYEVLWEEASPEERAAATGLVAETKAAAGRYQDYEEAVRAGYAPNRGAGENATHHPNHRLMRDGKVLEPTAPESLVYWTAPDGQKVLVGVVYKAGPDEDAPAPGGELTAWHTHAGGTKCHPASEPDCPQDGVRMLHVFFFEGVEDPFTESMVAAAGGRAAFARAMAPLVGDDREGDRRSGVGTRPAGAPVRT